MLRHTSNFGCELEPLGDILDVCQSGRKRIPFAGDWEPRLRVKGSCVTDKEASARKGLSPKLHHQERDSKGQRRYLAPQKRVYRWLGMDTGFRPIRGPQK